MTTEKNKKTEGLAMNSLRNLFDASKINFSPSYQRNEVWSRYQKQLLIDSLFAEYDIPKVYFHNKKDGDKTFYDVVDGQQRLKAILGFMNDEFPLSKDSRPGLSNKKYSDLDVEDRIQFDMFTVDICFLQSGYDEDDINDMFLRLQFGTPLNAAEKRRALGGVSSMPRVVKSLAQHKIFEYCIHGGNNRYAYEDAVAKALHILLAGNGDYVGISPKAIEKTYRINPELKETDNECARLKSAYHAIQASFKKIGIQPGLKKWSTITLPLVVDQLLGGYSFRKQTDKIAKVFLDLETARIENCEKAEEDQDPSLSELTDAARADSPASLRSRHEIVMRRFLTAIPDLVLKDSKREFSHEQRLAIFYRASPPFTCQSEGCDKKITQSDFEADHILAFTDGGPTSVENGQALCMPCNRAKGSS
jgi:hypothetical protein